MKIKTLLTLFSTSLILTNCNGIDNTFTDGNFNNIDSGSLSSSIKNYPTNIKQTGQSRSFDINGVEVTDGSIRDDGYYQTGAIREFVKSSDGIEDISSGLIWENTTHTKDIELTYSEAKEYCSNLSINGNDNWRLPTIKELLELVNYQKRAPSLDREFTNVVSGTDNIGYWSSSVTSGGFFMWISFNTGNDHFYSTNSKKHYVKCVEETNSNWSSANFTREESGIVIDNNSKLFWQDNKVVESKDWKEAIDYCESLTLAGYSDWRVPNINELVSIIDNSASSIKIDKTFKNSSDKVYWSSTTHSANSKISWDVNFKYGTNSYHSKRDKQAIRCVRGGELVSKLR